MTRLDCGIQSSICQVVLLQAIGVATLVGRIAPSLPIHASTQMSITSADGADFARQLGRQAGRRGARAQRC